MQPLELKLHLMAQLQIQRPERLIQQKDFGLVHHRPGDGHPLALPAGKLMRHPLFIAGKLHEFQRLGNRLFDRRLADPFQAQAVADVALHRHMRKKRVILENRIDVAPVWLLVRHILSFQQHPSAVRLFQTRNNP